MCSGEICAWRRRAIDAAVEWLRKRGQIEGKNQAPSHKAPESETSSLESSSRLSVDFTGLPWSDPTKLIYMNVRELRAHLEALFAKLGDELHGCISIRRVPADILATQFRILSGLALSYASEGDLLTASMLLRALTLFDTRSPLTVDLETVILSCQEPAGSFCSYGASGLGARSDGALSQVRLVFTVHALRALCSVEYDALSG